ncbi:dephospho-CoA kinase [Oscillospiraceae bacterium MB24-C1]|nr:dephospho-CoA kinase [Oscillospiraceae bacterium MB24-C1]
MGTLNRKKLAEIVFGDSKNLSGYNTLIFPYIRSHLKDKIEQLEAQGKTGCDTWMPQPCLESGIDADCDSVIAVIANPRQVAPQSHRCAWII